MPNTSTDLYHAIFMGLPISATLLNNTGEVVAVNDTAVKVLDIPLNETLPYIVHNQEFATNWHNAITKNTPYTFTYTHNKCIYQVVVTPINEKLYLLCWEDVTEQRLNEEIYNDFIANASHEIKTPLTSILGMSETILENYRHDPEVIEEFMPMIYTQSLRMRKLLNDLLNFATIKQQAMTPPQEIITLPPLLEEAIKLLKWEMLQHDNNVHLVLTAHSYKVRGDASQLVQVFCNLLNNAIKYGKADSTIVIDVSSVIREQKLYCIKFIDQGEGIPEEHIHRLVEKFYRVEKSRKRTLGGTGLGLAIVKQILERHGGFLEIHSVLKQGSVFAIYLPALD